MTTSETTPILSELRGELTGEVISRSDALYDDHRQLYNGMLDKHPLAIARCADINDVVTAVRRAVQHGVRLAVRGAGHNGAGLGSVDDGLVIDLGEMRAVAVDADARIVRVQGGATMRDVDAATAVHGLAVPMGFVSSTGVGGLTLTGGTGYLTRAFGLTIDNLVEAQVVLADGDVVTASETSHPDLFWGLRGGGGNFGIVTQFTFRAHAVDEVFGGPVFWDIDDAEEMLRSYRDHLPGASERLSVFAGLKTVPMCDPFPTEHQGKTVGALIACYNGPEDEARTEMEPMMAELPPPLFDWRMTQPFAQLQQLFDGLMPSGMQWSWHGDFVTELPDEAIARHVAHGRRLGPGAQSVMHFYPIDGAVHRVAPEATAWRCRDARWSLVIAGISSDPADSGAIDRWAKDYHDDVHRFSSQGGYLNFMMADQLTESAGRIRATYGDNYERLRRVKAIYDPGNVFRVNANIPPADDVVSARP